jgi:hypothetical protein
MATTTTTTTYNGWTNYETWCVNLWLTNEPDTEADLRMLSQMAASLYWRADRLRDYVNEMSPLDNASLCADLLQASLQSVDWREIVQSHEHDDDDGVK